MTRFFAVALFVVSLTSSPFATAADKVAKAGEWPQWRGPSRDGISPEKGLLQEFPEKGPKLLGEATGLGKGFSSVSVGSGKIFTMGDRGEEQYVIALNGKSGKEVWSIKIGKKWDNYAGPRCTPTIDGDRIYAVGSHGALVCLKAANGDVVWSKDFPKDFDGRMHSGWGFSESPLVDGDKLICTPGGKKSLIVALDKKTGKEIWKTEASDLGRNGGDGAAYSSVVVSNAAGVKQYVQLVGRGLVGVAADDGRVLWNYNRIANGTANIPTPVIDGDYVFGATGYGAGSAVVKIEKSSDGLKAEEVWFKDGKELQNHHGGMVLIDGYIYGGHGHGAGAPICVELKTGKIAWRENRGPGSGSAAVAYADGNLIFRYEDGTMALIAASPSEYKERGTFKLPGGSGQPSWPHPVVADGKLYLRDQDKLLVYNFKK